MSIEIKPDRYVSQIYFAWGAGLDVMGSLYRDPGEPFHLLYRFRYYDGPDQDKGPFADGDSKHWTEVVFDGPDGHAPEAAAIAICAGLFALVVADGSMSLSVLDLRTDDPKKILDLLRVQPWAHTMNVQKPGAEA